MSKHRKIYVVICFFLALFLMASYIFGSSGPYGEKQKEKTVQDIITFFNKLVKAKEDSTVRNDDRVKIETKGRTERVVFDGKLELVHDKKKDIMRLFMIRDGVRREMLIADYRKNEVVIYDLKKNKIAAEIRSKSNQIEIKSFDTKIGTREVNADDLMDLKKSLLEIKGLFFVFTRPY